MKKYKARGVLGLLVSLAVLVFAAISANGVGNTLQYMIPAPAPVQQSEEAETKPNQQIADLLKRLDEYAEADWLGLFEAYALSGIKEGVNFSPVDSTGTPQTGRLTALGPNSLVVDPLLFRFGRGFTYDELKDGYRGIILDETLALKLFGVGDAVGKKVQLEGQEYLVVGIARHSKQVGDKEEFGAYIPLNSIIDQPVQLIALMVSAKPIKGVGAKSSFESVLTQSWAANGTMIDLTKETIGALMPMRVLIFAAGFVVMLMLIAFINGKVREFAADYQQRLRRTYAVRLLPRLIGAILLFALGYGAVALGLAKLVEYVVDPVYTFPEWVPAILVEWEDIKTAYWNVWQGYATLQELRSPELLRVRYFGFLAGWASAGVAVFGTVLFFTLRKKIALRKE